MSRIGLPYVHIRGLPGHRLARVVPERLNILGDQLGSATLRVQLRTADGYTRRERVLRTFVRKR